VALGRDGAHPRRPRVVVAPPAARPERRRARPDVNLYFYPLYEATAARLAAGVVPTWKKIGRSMRVSVFAPTSPLRGASTSPPPFRSDGPPPFRTDGRLLGGARRLRAGRATRARCAASAVDERARRRAAEDDGSPVIDGRPDEVDPGPARESAVARGRCRASRVDQAGRTGRRPGGARHGPRVARASTVAAAGVAANEAASVVVDEPARRACDPLRATRFGGRGRRRAVHDRREGGDEPARVVDLARRHLRTAAAVARRTVAPAGRAEDGAEASGGMQSAAAWPRQRRMQPPSRAIMS
jgi:hypothetical protein